MNKKILIVGGNWDLDKGKESGFIRKFYEEFSKYSDEVTCLNGGNYNDLESVLKSVRNYGVVCWFAHVDNSLPKVRDVKAINPYAIFIGAKRNDNNKYPFVEVLNKAIKERHNLSIEFSKQDNGVFKSLLTDPLGVKWYEGTSIPDLVEHIYKRLVFLQTIRRQHTYSIEGDIEIPDDKEFFEFVKESAETFHKTIDHSEGVTRFMGNASFRGDGYIYVSKRDVDKSKIDKDNFVACRLDNGLLRYYGINKASKDAITQAHLYTSFPRINYMIHSHCYVEDGKYTEMPVPCGSLDEIDEIDKVIQKEYNGNYNLPAYRINYLGHGCLLLADSVANLKTASFIPRQFPEELKNVEEILDRGFQKVKN